MISIIYLLLLVATTKSENMDYTNNDFLLYKDTKDVLIYESYADLFHITNISLQGYQRCSYL